MKKIFLLVILAASLSSHSQTLKDALYSGKLKMDSGAVIRKSDDWTSKIDTSTKKTAEPEKAKAPIHDAATPDLVMQGDSIAIAGAPSATTTTSSSATGTIPSTTTGSDAGTKDDNNADPKSNNKIWKDYIDEFTGTLRTEVMPSKKIKSGTYSVLIDYVIDVDGQIDINNVTSSPESPYLVEQIKTLMTLNAPKMTPLLNQYGKPRKAQKKYTLVISK